MRRILLFFLFLFLLKTTTAQQNPAIYIHTDRDFYFPGDTVWFKGYVIDNGFLSSTTLNLYIKIAEENGQTYQQSVALVSKGITASHFVVPATYQGQELFINAYTRMMNCPLQTSYFKRIGVLQSDSLNASLTTTSQSSSDQDYQIRIYPEGGVLLSEMENQLIIQSHDGHGYPAVARGKLTQEDGKSLTSFETDSAGYAQIKFTPVSGAKYIISWVGEDQQERKNKIRESQMGAKAIIQSTVDKTTIQLMGNLPDQQVVLYAKLGKRTLFEQEFTLTKDKKISIPLKNEDLEYGILQVTVQDHTGQTLSKRNHLLGEKTMLLEPVVQLQRGSGEKSGNKLAITLPDLGESADLSISVTAIEVPMDSSTNIFTDLYLQPMAQKNLIQPFTLWQHSKDKDLFIQMQEWADLNCPIDDSITKDSLLMLKGQIKMDKNRWAGFYKNYQDILKKEPKKRGATFGYQDFTASAMQYVEIDFDALGRFHIPNLIVFDSMDTKFNQIYRKLQFEPFHITYEFIDPTIAHRPFFIPPGYIPSKQHAAWENKKWDANPHVTIDASGKRVLQTVTINRDRKQREIDRLERRFYTAGIPTNVKPDQVLVPLLDSLVLKRSQTLEDYLFNNIRTKRYEVYLNGRYIKELSPDSISNIKADKFYGDHISFLNEDIVNFPYIKFYSTFALAKGRPAVLIYQSAPHEVNKDIGKAVDEQTIMGYLPVKQYAVTTYETVAKKFSSGYDERTTLYWNPFITISAGESTPEYTFFNNSKANGYCLTIQGISNSGKIIYYRKVFR